MSLSLVLMLSYGSFGILHFWLYHHKSNSTIPGGTFYIGGISCLIIGDVNFDHIIKVAPASFSIVKLVFLFGNDKYFGGESMLNFLFLFRLSPTHFSIHQWNLSTTIINVIFIPNDDFIVFSSFIN